MAYLASGGDGCISIVANLFPDLCHEIQEGCGTGNVQVPEALPVASWRWPQYFQGICRSPR